MEPNVLNHYINRTLELGVDRNTLRQLAGFIEQKKKYILIGYNDYTKHIINCFSDQIISIIDPAKVYQGIGFRGKQVHDQLPDTAGVDGFIICKFDLIPQYIQAVKAHSKHQRATLKYPTSFGDKLTRDYELIEQSELYRSIFSRVDGGELHPYSSMMETDGILLLLELLRSTSDIPGDVVEIGVWQGGSAFFIAKLLAQLNLEYKNFYLLDFFEEHPSNHPKGIMCKNELEKLFDFYPGVDIISGDIRKTIQTLKGKSFSFVHYDMGYQKPILDVVVDQLSPGGIMLLDNYGHVAANPVQFDEYMKSKGLYCARVPYSAQCIVFKNK